MKVFPLLLKKTLSSTEDIVAALKLLGETKSELVKRSDPAPKQHA